MQNASDHPIRSLSDRPIEALLFDAYGTLFDVNAAVMRHAAGIGPEAPRLAEIWRGKQLEYTWVLSLSGRVESFWTLTERALDVALARCGVSPSRWRGPLLDAYRVLDAYPEVRGVLDGLRRSGMKVGVLSNGDPAMLADAVRAAGLDGLLDPVVSVEAAGVFKTAPAAYSLGTAALGLPPERIAFASSNRWDVAGATAFGFPCLWINRSGLPDEYPGLAPVAALNDLNGLISGP